MRRIASGVPIFQNGAITGAFAYVSSAAAREFRFRNSEAGNFAREFNLSRSEYEKIIADATSIGSNTLAVNWVDLGLGTVDFISSTAVAGAGVLLMVGSIGSGPFAPAGFYPGAAAATTGAAGMYNSGISMLNAIYDRNFPGLFEAIGKGLGGPSGARAGELADLFTGFRAGALGAAGMESIGDGIGAVNAIRSAQDEFSEQ